jgi:hypothetical protein
MGVITGADLCVNLINGTGTLYGGGTICKALVEIQSAENELPSVYNLSQNYPNPFNPTTVIKYQLPREDFVSIKVYDQLGREISVLFEGKQQAGYYNLEFDGTNLATGVYFYKISSRDYEMTKKMVLVK